jgi:hydroxymethylpyrimidine/phosphomethylpyrimidine kinase
LHNIGLNIPFLRGNHAIYLFLCFHAIWGYFGPGARVKTLLTIAGFDPSSGAGVSADLAVFGALGYFGTACVTALTVQSTVGVRETVATGEWVVAETLDCLEDDLPADGIKIGMLATAANVEAVAAYVEGVKRRRGGVPVVLDPVLRSSSGRELLSAEGICLLRERLLPLVDWMTPNLAELSVLSGEAVETQEGMLAAAAALKARYRTLKIVATGGHLPGNMIADLVVTEEDEEFWIHGERVAGRATHGTGCAYSSAFLCGLARGEAAPMAAHGAHMFVAGAIRHAVPLGRGEGPMNFRWCLG